MNRVAYYSAYMLLIFILLSSIVVIVNGSQDSVEHRVEFELYTGLRASQWPVFKIAYTKELFIPGSLANLLVTSDTIVLWYYNYSCSNVELQLIDLGVNESRYYVLSSTDRYWVLGFNGKALFINNTSEVFLIGVDGITSYDIWIGEDLDFRNIVAITSYDSRIYMIYRKNYRYYLGYIDLLSSNRSFTLIDELSDLYVKELGPLKSGSVWFIGSIVVYLNNNTYKYLGHKLVPRVSTLSPDGRYVIGEEENLLIYDLLTGVRRYVEPSTYNISSFAMALDHAWISDHELMFEAYNNSKKLYCILDTNDLSIKILNTTTGFDLDDGLRNCYPGYFTGTTGYSLTSLFIGRVENYTADIGIELGTHGSIPLKTLCIDGDLLVLTNNKLYYYKHIGWDYRAVVDKLHITLTIHDNVLKILFNASINDPSFGQYSAYYDIDLLDAETRNIVRGTGAPATVHDKSFHGSLEIEDLNTTLNLSKKYMLLIKGEVSKWSENYTGTFISKWRTSLVIDLGELLGSTASKTQTSTSSFPTTSNTGASRGLQESMQGTSGSETTGNSTSVGGGDMYGGLVLTGILVAILVVLVVLIYRFMAGGRKV